MKQGMRVCMLGLSARLFVGALLASASVASALAAPVLDVDGNAYEVISTRRVSDKVFETSLYPKIGVFGGSATDVYAYIESTSGNVTVIDGVVAFGNVPQSASSVRHQSTDAVTLRIATSFSLDGRDLRALAEIEAGSISWLTSCRECEVNAPPIARAGADVAADVGRPITLDAAASTDQEGQRLTYRWTLIARPVGSTASFSSQSEVRPTLTLDIEGEYLAQLVVNDGNADSAPSVVAISTSNVRPVAVAGIDRKVSLGERVALDGDRSTDADGDLLTYQWSLLSRPASSEAILSASQSAPNPAGSRATIDVDTSGTYVLSLTTFDGSRWSLPDTIVLSTHNSPPVAQGITDRTVSIPTTFAVFDTQSHDPDGDFLTHRWDILSGPIGGLVLGGFGNTAVLTIDRPGTYVVQTTVSDSQGRTSVDTFVVSTANSPPLADAGADLHAFVGDVVALSGLQSQDPNNDGLAFNWAMTQRPVGSQATLAATDTPQPTFVADMAGRYVVQLIVNDGRFDSSPTTSRIVVDVLQDRAAPIVTTNIVDGMETNQIYLLVTLSVNESASVNINGWPIALQANRDFSFSMPLQEGANPFTFIATDVAGNSSTRSATVVLDVRSPSVPDVTRITAIGAANGMLSVNGSVGSAEPNSTIFVTNLRTGAVVSVVAASDGSFAVQVAGTPGDRFSIRAIDRAGNQSSSAEVTSAAGSPLVVAVSYPASGIAVAHRQIFVSGTVSGAADVGVAINGEAAITIATGSTIEFSGLVELEAGTNEIAIVARAPDGREASRSLTISRANELKVGVEASVVYGVAPLSVEFAIARFAPIEIISARYDFDGNGADDQVDYFADGPREFTFQSPGRHRVQVKLTDGTGVTHSFELPIVVVAPAEIETRLRGQWSKYSQALSNRNTALATSMFSESVRARYAEVFSQLEASLPAIAASMSEIQPVTVGTSFAEFAVSRVIDGETHVFFVDFVQDSDGLWRIAGM